MGRLIAFSISNAKKDTIRAIYVCVESFCPWRVRARLKDEGIVKVTSVEGEHNCLTRGMHPRPVIANQAWLYEAVSRHIQVIPSTRPREIIRLVSAHYHETIDYQVALKVRNSLLKDKLGDHRYAFQLIPSYQALLEEADPEGHFHLELAADGTTFSRFLLRRPLPHQLGTIVIIFLVLMAYF